MYRIGIILDIDQPTEREWILHSQARDTFKEPRISSFAHVTSDGNELQLLGASPRAANRCV